MRIAFNWFVWIQKWWKHVAERQNQVAWAERIASVCSDSTPTRMMRGRNGNTCSIGVQIGVITGPCIADCGFCGFAVSTTRADDYVMPSHVLRQYLEHVTAYDDVESVSLMTIHNFDFDDLMELVDTAVEAVPDHVSICVNTGDVSPEEARELKGAGVRRAYHSLRIDEGDDTRLNPSDRFATIRTLSHRYR